MKTQWFYRIGLGLLIAALLYWMFPNNEPNPRPYFWQLNVEGDALSILHLRLQEHSLLDVNNTVKALPKLALFTTRQKQGAAEPAMHLEAYYDDLYDEGDRMIVGLEAEHTLLKHIKEQAYQPELFPNNVIRIGVKDDLLEEIQLLKIRNITLIAGERISFEDFEKQYTKANSFIHDTEGNAHFLYPSLGLDFIQPSEGLQILQFVAPELFASELLAPLQKAHDAAQ